MKATFGGREIRQMYEGLGGRECCRQLGEALQTRELRAEDLSIRDLFENMIPDGRELLRSIEDRKSGRMNIVEASNAVDQSAFSNITGQIIYNKMLEGYENPELLWPDLCDELKTTFLNGERLPGIGGTGDVAEVVDEGQPYPIAGTNEEYVDYGPAIKRGFIIPITREIIVADRTGLLLKRCSDSGYHYLGINMEKRAMNIVTGQTNTYKRNGVITNTYLTSGSYVNSQTGNTFISWRSINSAELLFDAIQDPNTGEPIIVSGEMVLLVPSALKMDAIRVMDVRDIGQVDNQANATTVRAYGPNPVAAGKMVNATGVKVLSNAYVKNATSSATQWFYGQPKKAFLKRTVWEIEAQQAASNSEAEFMQDIWQRHKISEMSMFGTQNPRYMTKNAP